MKRFLATLAVLALAVSAFAFSAAASTKADVMAAAKEAIPAEYEYLYLAQLETVLNATDPDAAACTELIELIEKNAELLTNKGASLSNYTDAEREAVLADFDDAATLLGVTYEIEPASNDANDVKAVIYYNNEPIVELDGDAIKQTDAEQSASMVWPVAVAAVLLTAVAAFVFGKKALN